jgi:hypothetical protein
MKTLNVQKITFKELLDNWGTCAYIGFRPGQEIFIRSNAKGLINWDKAPAYTWQEIQTEMKRRPVHFTVDPKIFELP